MVRDCVNAIVALSEGRFHRMTPRVAVELMSVGLIMPEDTGYSLTAEAHMLFIRARLRDYQREALQ